MSVEFDHLFICVSQGGAEAEHLRRFGLVEGPPNVHRGQGTANRRFFFRNAMLELLWVEDAEEARNEQTAPTQLWDRWSRRMDGVTSPFGVIMRPVEDGTPPPFAAWQYKPDYLPAEMCLQIGVTGIDEPMWVFMPFATRRDVTVPEHPSGVREITGLRLTSPTPPRSAAAEALALLTIESGPSHLLSIEFDHGVQGDRNDFRPHLPLIFMR